MQCMKDGPPVEIHRIVGGKMGISTMGGDSPFIFPKVPTKIFPKVEFLGISRLELLGGIGTTFRNYLEDHPSL